MYIKGYSQATNDGFKVVKLRRLLDTNDKFDAVLSQNSKQDLIWAKGPEKSIAYHGPTTSNRAYVTFDFTQGAKGDATLEDSAEKWLKAHEVILIVGWGFLTDIAVIFARYFRSLNFYLDIHALIFIVVDLSTLTILIAYLVRGNL